MKNFSQFEDSQNNNFNLIRLSAALIVLYTHSYGLSGKLPTQSETPLAYLLYLLGNVGVDLFFLVSGFLVTRSYVHRKHFIAFLWARFLRIYPGLICAVLFSVFVIGLYDTQLSVVEYLKHKDIYHYIMVNLSLVKTVVALPGIFETNHYAGQINGSLWTLPAEVRLYLYVAIFGLLGVFLKTRIINIVACILLVMYFISPENIPLISDNKLYYYPALLFLIGSLFYINKSIIPASGWLLSVLCVVLIYVVYYQYQYKDIVYTVCLSYTVFWIAYNLPILHIYNKLGDYSYGIYIYAFPIQQLIISRRTGLHVDLFFFYSLFFTLIFAILSWHLIEKPALKLKRF